MGLSAHEKRTLDEIADRLYAEDPALAESLSSFATGVITAEPLSPPLPARRGPFPAVLIPIALLAAIMVIMAVVLPPITGTAGTGADPAPASHALTGG